MSVLIDSHGVIEDCWIRLADDEPVDNAGAVVFSLNRLLREGDDPGPVEVKLGVALEATDQVAVIEPYLPRLQMIGLSFTSFADGRAFSQARLLRERFSFKGSIRAQGEVIPDQLAFMQRCGFDQFVLADDEDVDLALHAMRDISQSYQPPLRQYVGG